MLTSCPPTVSPPYGFVSDAGHSVMEVVVNNNYHLGYDRHAHKPLHNNNKALLPYSTCIT